MMYVGLIHFEKSLFKKEKLQDVIQNTTGFPARTHSKDSFIFCWGKSSLDNDPDTVLENDSSLIAGRVFSSLHNTNFNQDQFKRLSNFRSEDVLEKIWGKYVFIKKCPKPGEVEVIIDSTGQLPFFYTSLANGDLLFASNIELIFRILNQKPTYNWNYLCSYLMQGNNSSIETPFESIFELPPGCRLNISQRKIETTPFWNPLNSYNSKQLQEKGAICALKEAMKPWIEPYENVVVSLSGGLDSSSLVYCLKDIVRKDQNLKAINYYHSQIQSSNEFEFAKKVCDEANIELKGFDVSEFVPFNPPKNVFTILPNKPFPGHVSLHWLEMINKHVALDSSYTFISGHGSDHIFMRPPSKRSFSDYILERGTKGGNNQLKGIAHFYRDSIFSLLKENVKSLSLHYIGKKKEKMYAKERLKDLPIWHNSSTRQTALSEFYHPIYNTLPKNILPGKFDQVDAVYEGLASIHVDLTNSETPTYYPFLYQPVVEFALAFPTYNLFKEGYDRFPLRKAISDHYNTQTVWRRDKSQTTGLFQIGLRKNLQSILSLCLEGKFVQQGFLDAKELQKTMHRIASGDAHQLWPFIYVASAEMFLKAWDERM